MSDLLIIILALFAAFLAFRFIAGMVKFAVLALVVVGAIYFLGVA
jgi:hypothetical protein